MMQPLAIVTVGLLVLGSGKGQATDEHEQKFEDCPPAVRKTFQAEARGATIKTVTREKEPDEEAVYWADVPLNGRTYAIGILEDGTLSEMNLAVDEEGVAFDACPSAVQAMLRAEAFGEKVETTTKDIKYGATIYEAVVAHKGKSYNLVVAEDGTLVEKVLVIDDEEVDLAMCPAAVKAALLEQARGGKVGTVTRSTGIARPTYEAEIEIKRQIYLIEVDESGLLLAKSLEASED